MTSDEINEVMEQSNGKLSDWQCRCIVHYMMGYMRHASDLKTTRQEFFKQVKAATAGRTLPAL